MIAGHSPAIVTTLTCRVGVFPQNIFNPWIQTAPAVPITEVQISVSCLYSDTSGQREGIATKPLWPRAHQTFTWYHVDEIEHSSQGLSPLLHKAEEEPVHMEGGPADSKHED